MSWALRKDVRAAQRAWGQRPEDPGEPQFGGQSSKGHPNARLGSRTPQVGWGRAGEGGPGLRTCPQGSLHPALSVRGQPSVRRPPHCPTHPSAIPEPHQDVPSQLPTLQPSGCWAGGPAPSYSAHRPAQLPASAPLPGSHA